MGKRPPAPAAEVAAAKKKPCPAEEKKNPAPKGEASKEKARPAENPAPGGEPKPPPMSQAKVIAAVLNGTAGFEGDVAGNGFIKAWAVELSVYVQKELMRFLRENPELSPHGGVPNSPLLIPPLRITGTPATGGQTSFREVMNFENLRNSIASTSQYEAAGTVFMLDAFSDTGIGSDRFTPTSLGAAAQNWSPETFARSAPRPQERRFSFDVPIPAQIVDINVAQRASTIAAATGAATGNDVVFAKAVPVIAGRAMVVSWYAAMAEALEKGEKERVGKLLEAAVSVPIRLRMAADLESCRLASLSFMEAWHCADAASGAASFWQWSSVVAKLKDVAAALAANKPISFLVDVLKTIGAQHRGKPAGPNTVRALKAVAPFLASDDCWSALSLAESCSPELRDPTILMFVANHCSAKAAFGAEAGAAPGAEELLVFSFNCMRAFRISGDHPKRSAPYTTTRLVGADKKSSGLLHEWCKKRDLVDYLWHELELMTAAAPGAAGTTTAAAAVAAFPAFRAPMDVLKRFSATGEHAGSFGDVGDNDEGRGGFASEFALQVAEYQERLGDAAAKALTDLLWGLWSGEFDDAIASLCAADLAPQPAPGGFLWHRYLNDASSGLGEKYRAFAAATTKGPVAADESAAPGALGMSEFGLEEREDAKKIQELVSAMRRKTVTFASAPGEEVTAQSLAKVWSGMRLGHSWPSRKKKESVRAFVFFR